ncbi:MAG: hypothetical protein ACOYXY_17745 [Thermodesulfobacteriota bacterium]
MRFLLSNRLAAVAFCAIMVVIPFLTVQYPPITDLPQQAAQIRLFWETVNDPGTSPYRINWLSPYNLSYVILAICTALFGLITGGKVAMMIIVILWIVAIHYVASARNRPVESAVLASVFAFNLLIYWGFYSFALGMPLFLVWVVLNASEGPENLSWRDTAKWTLMALLLYFAHLLWFVAACVVVPISNLLFLRDTRAWLQRVATLIPALVLLAVWSTGVADENIHAVEGPIWSTIYSDRISFGTLVNAALGGIRGVTEHIVIWIVVLWIAIALRQRWGHVWPEIDKSLLLTCGSLLLMAMLWPDLWDISVLVWQRWLPPAAVLFVLAMPPPDFSDTIRKLVAAGMVLFLSLMTAATWISFEKNDLSGLTEVLKAVPPASKVMGLDFIRSSPRVKGRPFLQIFAYAQVTKGAQLNFSFAEFQRGLVAYKNLPTMSWSGRLVWHAETVKPSDVSYFDYVIVGTTNERVPRILSDELGLTPVTRTGNWQLYRVNR